MNDCYNYYNKYKVFHIKNHQQNTIVIQCKLF